MPVKLHTWKFCCMMRFYQRTERTKGNIKGCIQKKKKKSKTELPSVTIRKITRQNGGTGGVKTKGLA